MTPLRLGLVGAGGISQSWLRAVGEVDDVELVAIADPDPAALDRALASHDAACASITTVDSAAALARDVDLDAAIVACPPAAHVDAALALLDAGVAVLCEKPLTVDLSSARRLIAAADASGVLLAMASKFRYVDAVARLRAMVDAGELGDVLWYRNTFAASIDMAKRWNSDPAIAGGGVIIDNGTHAVDVARYILGPIQRVQAVAGRRWQELEVEDTATLLLATERGATATIELSWSLSVPRRTYIELDGTLGSARVGWEEAWRRTSGDPTWEAFAGAYDKAEAFRRNLIDFVGAARGAHAPLIDRDDVLASVAVVEAAYRSLGDQGWVDVEQA